MASLAPRSPSRDGRRRENPGRADGIHPGLGQTGRRKKTRRGRWVPPWQWLGRVRSLVVSDLFASLRRRKATTGNARSSHSKIRMRCKAQVGKASCRGGIAKQCSSWRPKAQRVTGWRAAGLQRRWPLPRGMQPRSAPPLLLTRADDARPFSTVGQQQLRGGYMGNPRCHAAPSYVATKWGLRIKPGFEDCDESLCGHQDINGNL